MSHMDSQSSRSSRRRLGAAASAGMGALATVVALSALAFASGGAVVKSAANPHLGQIVVSAQGRTLYALRPETARHLLCKSRECFAAWPPLTVRSRKVKLRAGAGVHGRLGILRRGNGMLQVTLNGMPLYRFGGDSRKGEANGQHIHSFGGVWHVIPARHGKSMGWSGTSTTTSTSGAMTTSTEWPASTSSSSTSLTTSSTLSTTSATSTTSTTKSTTSCLYPPC